MSTQDFIEENKTLKKQIAKLRADNMELAMQLTTKHEELGKYKKVVEVARETIEYKPDSNAHIWCMIPREIKAKLEQVLKELEK